MIYFKKVKALIAALAVCVVTIFSACDEISSTGGSLVEPNITINIDSSFNVTGQSFHQKAFDSRSATMLLGAVDMEGIGSYSSSVVTQLMAATSLSMPDSIKLDSVSGMALKLNFRKGALTGDSLAPCRLKVFALTRQLPSDIQSSFDPAGYYDASAPIGVKSYTASTMGTRDSASTKDLYAHIKVDLPLSMARKIITQYRTDASVFKWPQTFNQYFPGLYIENAFGKGCMVNITVAEMAVYYQRAVRAMEIINDSAQYVVRSHRDSVTLFSTSPEVLSSNNLRMNIAQPIHNMVEQGKVVVMSPCGYLASIHIPAQEIVDRYYKSDFDLAVVNNLLLTIPARVIANNYDLRPAPNLLLVRRKDMTSFFAENRIPDPSKMSFYGTYNAATGLYTFTSMRQYIVDILKKGGTVEAEDMDFVVVPVAINTDFNAMNQATYVTACFPYIYRPTLCELDMENAVLKFTYGAKH